MPKGEVYLQDELEHKDAQKIIKYFRITEIAQSEKVMAAAGAVNFLGPSNALVIVNDRILVVDFSNSKHPVHLISFLDYKNLDRHEINDLFRIYVLLNDGSKVDTGFDLTDDEFHRLSSFIEAYRSEGYALAQSYKDQGIDTLHYAKKEQKLQSMERIKRRREKTDQQFAPIMKSLEDKMAENEKKIAELEEKTESLIKQKDITLAKIDREGAEAIRLAFEADLDKIYAFPYLIFRPKYCGGIDGINAGGRHWIEVYKDKQIVNFLFPGNQNITIPFMDILGAKLRRSDGIPQNQLTDRQYIEAGTIKQLYYIDIYLRFNGKDTTVIYSNMHTRWEKNSNLFIVEYICNRIAKEFAGMKDKQPSSSLAPASSVPLSAADEIKKFKDLLDQDVITQEEFDAKKKQLLNI